MNKTGVESTSSAPDGARPEPRASAAEPDSSLPSPDTLAGTVIDSRFRVDGLLAVGGMGSVYRAEQLQLRRPVALKVLHPSFAASAKAADRFRQEAEVAAHLESDHVVKIIDFGKTEDGRFYLVMELLQGESLHAVIERDKRLAPPRVVDLLRQTLEGLRVAHQAGIVHRDLKPENLWVSPAASGERLKILDFGIARLLEEPVSTAKTQAGLVLGTPEYLAPEQALGQRVDRRADLYSVGIIAYVALTGRHPFDTSNVRALLQAHALSPVPLLTDVAPDLAVWPRLVEFCRRSTEKEPSARAQSAEQLLRVLDGAEVSSRTPPPHPAPSSITTVPPPRISVSPRAALAGVTTSTENLAIMFTDIVGFTELTARQSREENARMLAEHDRLLLPVVRAFKGRKVKSLGDALLVVFRSPTDSVLCGMAIQDQLARYNAAIPEADRIVVRVAINLGEVRVERGDIFGDAVNVASRVEGETPPGEVWLTEAVNLAMNRREVPVVEAGVRSLRGVPEPVRLFRVVRGDRPLPFGGGQLGRVDASGEGLRAAASVVAATLIQTGRWASARTRALGSVLIAMARSSPLRLGALASGAALASLAMVVAMRLYTGPVARARRALSAGQAEQVLVDLSPVDESAETLYLKARALSLLKRPDEAVPLYRRAVDLSPGLLQRPDLLADVSLDLAGLHAEDAAALLVQAGRAAVDLLLEAAGDATNHERRWRAIEALKQLKQDDRIDYPAAYIADLKVEDCVVVKRAVHELGELGDQRAVEPLRALAERRSFLFEHCGAAAARAALRKLERETDAHGGPR